MDTLVPSAPLAPISAPQSSTARRIFIGRFGLRAGWSAAIFVLIFALTTALVTFGIMAAQGKLQAFLHKRHTAQSQQAKTPAPAEPMKPRITVINESLAFATLLFAAWSLSRIERRRLGVYGIGANRLRDILPGAFWGVVCLSILVGILRASHLLVFDARLLYGSVMVLYALKWLLAFFCVGMLEEYLFRGYLQYTIMRGVFGLAERLSATNARAVAFWITATLLSALFLLAHGKNPGETIPGLMSVFLAGMVFAYALFRTGSLWWAIGFHATWDWAQSFLYGVPDSGGLGVGRLFQTHPTGNPLYSGGSVGPEGSIFLIPLFLAIFLIIRFTTRPGTQPTLEPRTKLLDTTPPPYNQSPFNNPADPLVGGAS